MELFGKFLVFFLVYGTLHYLFSERKRKTREGQIQPRKRAIVRTAASAALAGIVFIILMEVIEIF
ncbi:MAG: hypothetical protein EA403_15480 [Spirochaetaceae bacterium]|nr:MAG: hypothetical protein EA403_15480 [Spirochaetaceae bacterium]